MPLQDFENTINKMQAFDFGQELLTIVADNTEKLADYVKEQLAVGTDGDDKPNTIFGRKGYSQKTVEIKQANGVGLGAETSYITNYMTGEFYNTLLMKTEADTFEADSPVSYFGDITLYSSEDLLKVDEIHRKDFGETVTLPGISEALLSKTGLKLGVHV